MHPIHLPAFFPALALTSVLLSSCSSTHSEARWPSFRGPNGAGVAEGESLPRQLDLTQNLYWKVSVPEGNSSPVLGMGRLYITATEADDRLVLAFDAESGKPLWKKAYRKAREETWNSLTGFASPTPAVDGGRLYVLFPDIGLLALSLDGEELWQTPLGPFKSLNGIATSPVAAGGKVLVLIDQLEDSYIAAFDALTGARLWKSERLNGITGGYSTPIIAGFGQDTIVLVAGARELTAYDLKSGEKVWWASGLTTAPIGVPVVDGENVYVCEMIAEGFTFSTVLPLDKNGDGKIALDEISPDDEKKQPGTRRFVEALDRDWGNGDGLLEASEWDKAFSKLLGKGGVTAVRLGGQGEIGATHVAWHYGKSVAFVPSVLLYKNTLFAVRDGGILTSLDASTGNVLKQARLEGAGGDYRASPVAGDGKVFLLSGEGRVSVVKAQPQWEILSSSDLGAGVFATPALFKGRVYVRTAKELCCFK